MAAASVRGPARAAATIRNDCWQHCAEAAWLVLARRPRRRAGNVLTTAAMSGLLPAGCKTRLSREPADTIQSRTSPPGYLLSFRRQSPVRSGAPAGIRHDRGSQHAPASGGLWSDTSACQ